MKKFFGYILLIVGTLMLLSYSAYAISEWRAVIATTEDTIANIIIILFFAAIILIGKRLIKSKKADKNNSFDANTQTENKHAVWIFACEDYEKVCAMAMFENVQHYYSQEHSIATVREQLSIGETEKMIFVKPAEWGAPKAKVVGSSFDVDMNKVNTNILNYLISYGYKKQEIEYALSRSSATMKPNLGILLISVNLLNIH
ncbi:MAG: hypothetical protein JXN65_07155 [Clostridia bacterium]|nr:hypothetical protein [Clostridia bacterium]